MHVLVVEDERKIGDFVCAGLRERGITVTAASDGDEGWTLASRGGLDVIVLDIMLPGRDGLTILDSLRQRGDTTPVLLLTARGELTDRVEGLGRGADDYLAKPFYVEELVARVQALARRVQGERQNYLLVGDLRLDRVAREVTCAGRTVDLTGREFNLLELLMRSPGRVFTRAQMLEQVWGYDFDPSTNVVDVCVQRIRRKISATGVDESAGSAIESVRGVGYRFRVGA